MHPDLPPQGSKAAPRLSPPTNTTTGAPAPGASVRDDRRSAALRAFLSEPRTRAEVRDWADTRGMSRHRLELALEHLGVRDG